jgi:hypothetical protein
MRHLTDPKDEIWLSKGCRERECYELVDRMFFKHKVPMEGGSSRVKTNEVFSTIYQFPVTMQVRCELWYKLQRAVELAQHWLEILSRLAVPPFAPKFD